MPNRHTDRSSYGVATSALGRVENVVHAHLCLKSPSDTSGHPPGCSNAQPSILCLWTKTLGPWLAVALFGFAFEIFSIVVLNSVHLPHWT